MLKIIVTNYSFKHYFQKHIKLVFFFKCIILEQNSIDGLNQNGSLVHGKTDLWILKEVGDVIRAGRAFHDILLCSKCSSAFTRPVSHKSLARESTLQTGLTEIMGTGSSQWKNHYFPADKASEFCI